MLGVPRLKELLDATHTPKTPVTTLWFRAPLCYDSAFVERFARTLPAIRLRALVTSTEILHEPDPDVTGVEADATTVAMDAYFRDEASPRGSALVVRLVLSKDEMRARSLTPPFLQHLLWARIGIQAHIMCSEVNSLSWVVRIRFAHVDEMMRMAGDTADSGMEVSLVRRVTNMLLDQLLVGGHQGVSSAHAREMQSWNAELERSETVYVVDAMGSILRTASLFPVVDAGRCTSNDPHEMAACLGIEAATATIHHEIETVISFDSTKVEKRHMQLVADSMTYRGVIIPMSRHGMNRPGNACGALVQASFEETADVLTMAATFARTDPGQGVTYSVMSGEESNIIGTGAFDLLLPEEAVAGQARASQRARRLAKSTISYAAPKAEDTVIGYVDKSLWCFSSTSGEGDDPMKHPFLDVGASDEDMVTDGRGASYERSGAESTSEPVPVMYVPSSPRVE